MRHTEVHLDNLDLDTEAGSQEKLGAMFKSWKATYNKNYTTAREVSAEECLSAVG